MDSEIERISFLTGIHYCERASDDSSPRGTKSLGKLMFIPIRRCNYFMHLKSCIQTLLDAWSLIPGYGAVEMLKILSFPVLCHVQVCN